MMVNRSRSSTAHATHRMTKRYDQGRKLRTRTLIQCGGLLSLSGLLEQCGITEGEDLQQDLGAYEKAATLLGVLMNASEALLHNNSSAQMEKFKKTGKTKMKQAGARYS